VGGDVRGGAAPILSVLERGLLGGILLGTCAAALLAARNNFTPTQAPLTFALVYWKWLCLAGLALAVPACLAGGLAARLAGRPWLARAALAALVGAFFIVVVVYNAKALPALVHQGGPVRYRILLPVAWTAATLGLLAAAFLGESRRVLARLLTPLALLAALGAFYPAGPKKSGSHAASRPPVRSTAQRVLVFGLDGADWELMEPLLARGELPHLAALRARGAWASLASFQPTSSPIIWTTIATGKGPDEHGVRGFTHKRLKGVSQPLPSLRPLKHLGFSRLHAQLVRRGEIYDAPIASSARKVPALWNIASAQGSPMAVVNWWATWPAEPTLGQIVSERTYYSILDGDPDADEEHLTHPEALFSEISGLLMRPEETSYDVAHRFLEMSPEEFETLRKAPQSGAKDIEAGLTYFYSLHETTRRLALHLMEKGRKEYGTPHDMLVLFRLVDMACHTSIHHSELVATERRGASPAQFQRYGRVVSEAYRQADRALGDLTAAFGEDGNVVVISDHGWDFQGDGTWGHRKAPDGILIAAGPAFRPGLVENLSVRDVLPLLLRLKGFPVAEDLAGRVPDEVFDAGFLRRTPMTTIASFGRRDDLDAILSSTDVDEEMVERLRALGYVE